MLFLDLTASQQESNRSWSSTFFPKQEQESNFSEWSRSQKIQPVRTFCCREGGEVIFLDFMRTFFMDGPSYLVTFFTEIAYC